MRVNERWMDTGWCLLLCCLKNTSDGSYDRKVDDNSRLLKRANWIRYKKLVHVWNIRTLFPHTRRIYTSVLNFEYRSQDIFQEDVLSKPKYVTFSSNASYFSVNFHLWANFLKNGMRILPLVIIKAYFLIKASRHVVKKQTGPHFESATSNQHS